MCAKERTPTNTTNMSDRDRASTASPSLMEAGLKTLIGGRDSNYPLISGINGKFFPALEQEVTLYV